MVDRPFNQMQVQNAIDLDFSQGVRAFDAAGSDIIMVGEIRDLETAESPSKAALTGTWCFHLCTQRFPCSGDPPA